MLCLHVCLCMTTLHVFKCQKKQRNDQEDVLVQQEIAEPLPHLETKPHLPGGKKILAFLSTQETAFLRKRFKVLLLPPSQTLDGSSLLWRVLNSSQHFIYPFSSLFSSNKIPIYFCTTLFYKLYGGIESPILHNRPVDSES